MPERTSSSGGTPATSQGDPAPEVRAAAPSRTDDDARADDARADDARGEGDARADETQAHDDAQTDPAQADDDRPAADDPTQDPAGGGDAPASEPPKDEAETDQHRFSRFSKAQVLVGVLVAALGFAIVVQLRQTEQQGLASLRQSDLVRILDDVGDRRDRLAAEASDLESQRRELSDVRTGDQAALDAAQARATTLGILAGTVAAKGPGVEVYITDPRGTVRAATLLDLVQELRDAGAEAIQIGSARVIASTAFSDVNGGVAVDNVMLRAPYTVRAIGDGQTMATALEIPGGVVASMPDGAHATVATRDELEVTALHAVPQPQYARPAVTPTPAPSGS